MASTDRRIFKIHEMQEIQTGDKGDKGDKGEKCLVSSHSQRRVMEQYNTTMSQETKDQDKN